jgi:hypothetical protein
MQVAVCEPVIPVRGFLLGLLSSSSSAKYACVTYVMGGKQGDLIAEIGKRTDDCVLARLEQLSLDARSFSRSLLHMALCMGIFSKVTFIRQSIFLMKRCYLHQCW